MKRLNKVITSLECESLQMYIFSKRSPNHAGPPYLNRTVLIDYIVQHIKKERMKSIHL